MTLLPSTLFIVCVCIATTASALLYFGYPTTSLAFALVGLMTCVVTTAISANNSARQAQTYLNQITKRKNINALLHEKLRNRILTSVDECQTSLESVKLTQDDAIANLGRSFEKLLETTEAQNQTIQKLILATSDPHDTAHLENITSEFESALSQAIRCIQFGDINAQNVQFIQASLNAIKRKY